MRFQCAVAARHRDEPLWATASTYRRWLLVEVPGAWGEDSVADTALGAQVSPEWRQAMRRRGIRVLAVRRDLGRHGEQPLTLNFVDAGRPGTLAPRAWRRTVPGLEQVAAATEFLAAGDPTDAWTEHRDRLVLICTNGRHDQCCAVQGRPVAKALRSGPWAAQVWESSHVGGDRFAANIVVLPDGVYLGRCLPDDVDDMLDQLAAGHLDPVRYRGLSTRSWAEQAAEHFARTHHNLWSLADVTATAVVSRDHHRTTVRVTLNAGDRYDVTVERRDEVLPTPLTCKGPERQRAPRWVLRGLNAV